MSIDSYHSKRCPELLNAPTWQVEQRSKGGGITARGIMNVEITNQLYGRWHHLRKQTYSFEKEYDSHLRFRTFLWWSTLLDVFFLSIWLGWYYELLIYNDKNIVISYHIHIHNTHKYVLRSFQYPSRPDPLTSSMSTGFQDNNSWTFWQMSQWPLSVVTVCGSTTTSMSPTSWHNVVGRAGGLGVWGGVGPSWMHIFVPTWR